MNLIQRSPETTLRVSVDEPTKRSLLTTLSGANNSRY